MRHFVVFPGMHGTTDLMDDFVATAPSDARVEVVALPTQPLGYAELASHFESTLRLTPDSVLIAESFSGPLAILLAERCTVAALILCNTFAKGPYLRALGVLPLILFARIPPPQFLVRYFIVGSSASDALVERVREVIASVPADLLASRARSALRIDVTSQLARCTSPILYLRGTQDHLVRERSVKAVVEAASEPVFVSYVKKAPHLLLKTSPREAWRAIGEFLAGAIAH
jgi:pimeloyl-[acyl-carrier protein] methyl ester esterase